MVNSGRHTCISSAHKPGPEPVCDSTDDLRLIPEDIAMSGSLDFNEGDILAFLRQSLVEPGALLRRHKSIRSAVHYEERRVILTDMAERTRLKSFCRIRQYAGSRETAEGRTMKHKSLSHSWRLMDFPYFIRISFPDATKIAYSVESRSSLHLGRKAEVLSHFILRLSACHCDHLRQISAGRIPEDSYTGRIDLQK